MRAIRQRRFWQGFIVGALLAVGLNLLPYFLTSGAYQKDDLEVMGFPFTFRALGGFAYRLYFYWWAFAVDLLFCGALGVLAGYAWLALFRPADARAEQ